MQVLILGWLNRERKRGKEIKERGMERRCRVKGVEEGSMLRHTERVTNGGTCQCLNRVCDCACMDEYMHVCRCLSMSVCVCIDILVRRGCLGIWMCVQSACVCVWNAYPINWTNTAVCVCVCACVCVCVCLRVTRKGVSCGCGTGPGCVCGHPSLGAVRAVRACEHYCNPNVNWNPDLTEVINRCVCVCVCVQSRIDGSASWWWDSGLLVGEPTTTLRGPHMARATSCFLFPFIHFPQYLALYFAFSAFFLQLQGLFVKIMSPS